MGKERQRRTYIEKVEVKEIQKDRKGRERHRHIENRDYILVSSWKRKRDRKKEIELERQAETEKKIQIENPELEERQKERERETDRPTLFPLFFSLQVSGAEILKLKEWAAMVVKRKTDREC